MTPGRVEGKGCEIYKNPFASLRCGEGKSNVKWANFRIRIPSQLKRESREKASENIAGLFTLTFFFLGGKKKKDREQRFREFRMSVEKYLSINRLPSGPLNSQLAFWVVIKTGQILFWRCELETTILSCILWIVKIDRKKRAHVSMGQCKKSYSHFIRSVSAEQL